MAKKASVKKSGGRSPNLTKAAEGKTAKLRRSLSGKSAGRTLSSRGTGKSTTRQTTKSAKAGRSSPPSLSAVKAEIAAVHARRGDVWLKRDAEGYLSNYADDALLVVDGSLLGLPALGSWLHATLAAGGGSLSMNLPPADNVAVSPKGDAATTVFQWGQRFRTAEGEVSDRTYVETNVWHRLNGAWKIVRMHITTLNKDVVT
jgi:ketosteroid isomerase-like protein